MSTKIIRPRVFLDVSEGTEPIGRLVIELFVDKAPKTCENFRALCTGSHPPLTYKMSPFHRIIDEFMVQGGDITKGNGTGGDSIYGSDFEDENIGWRGIDAAGLLCMANRGKDTNNSQFFITLVPCEHLNAKHTVFGHLVSGQSVLDRLAKSPVDRNDRPTTDVFVSHCGELERRKKNEDGEQLSQEASQERGRQKRRHSMSHSSPRSMSPSREHTRKSGSRHRHHHRKHRRPSSSSSSRSVSPEPQSNHRRSDAFIDHTLRGRLRQRSRSRTRSPLPESDTPSPQRHRKRSSPPSRSPGYGEHRSKSPDHRRQRSLPNQYSRHKKRNEDKDYNSRRYRNRDDENRLRQAEWERDGGADRYIGARDDTDYGRLGGGDTAGWDDEGNNNGIKYKGRGSMKYREKKRW